jgi:CDP-glucose 4,6-dehydratase
MSASMIAVNSLVPDRAFWQGRRVFLTGHTGFKGAWLVAWLSGLGAEVSAYSLPPATNPSLSTILGGAELCRRHVEGDVRDAAALADAMRAADPEIAIHMAAQPLVRYRVERQAI